MPRLTSRYGHPYEELGSDSSSLRRAIHDRSVLAARAQSARCCRYEWKNAALYAQDVVFHLEAGKMNEADRARRQVQCWSQRALGGDDGIGSAILWVLAIAGGVTGYWWVTEGEKKRARRRRS